MRHLVSWLQRRWLWLVIIIGFGALVITQFNNIKRLSTTLVQGQPQWLAAAVLLQILFYLVYSVQYKLGFETVGVESKVSELLPVLFASIFLKAVVPSGGISALAVFIDDAARRGQSPARAAEGALLVLVADLATMVPLIIYGLAYLAAQRILQGYQAIASALYILFISALTGFLLLGRYQPHRLRQIFEWAQDRINWLASLVKRPPLLRPDWAIGQAAEYCGAACDIADHPRPLIRTLGIAFGAHLINLTSLFAVSLAYLHPLTLGELLAAFSMDIVFSVINIIPHGLGVAEGVMALVLISLGVAATDAVTITIIFRGLNVWLPLLIGFFFLRRVRSLGGGA